MAELEEIRDELKKIEKNMVTKKDLEELKTTLEIMSNPETVKQIAESMRDIKAGRVSEVTSVKDMLREV